MNLREQLVRIDRAIAETRKLQQESDKFAAETRKIGREYWLAPLLAFATVVGASAAAVVATITVVKGWH